MFVGCAQRMQYQREGIEIKFISIRNESVFLLATSTFNFIYGIVLARYSPKNLRFVYHTECEKILFKCRQFSECKSNPLLPHSILHATVLLPRCLKWFSIERVCNPFVIIIHVNSETPSSD